MFEIELKNEKDAKEIIYHITMCTRRAKFIIKKDKKDNFTMKVYTNTHILDIINSLASNNEITTAHKITFKIDNLKHFYYIGMPY